jgi:hypothetical protein
MADPYAARVRVPVGEQPAGDGPAAKLVAEHGGLAVAALTDAETGATAEADFVGVVVRDETLLPPIARIDPAFAVMLLARAPAGSSGVRAALDALGSAAGEILLVKQGLVAGPAGRDGAFTVEADLTDDLLDAARRGRIVWERDPDFGYDVAAEAPGVSGVAADALCPRLLYAAADRVYEHAEAVADLKRERHRRASAIDGIDGRVLAATGWPIEPTGQSWKE